MGNQKSTNMSVSCYSPARSTFRNTGHGADDSEDDGSCWIGTTCHGAKDENEYNGASDNGAASCGTGNDYENVAVCCILTRPASSTASGGF